MLVVHHNDLDGQAAAAVVAQVISGARFYEIDYKDEFPFWMITPKEEVMILDFSLQIPEDWDKLFALTSNVTWIDHHETSIQKTPHWVRERNSGTLDTSLCGAALTWKWFFPNAALPVCIQLVDRWDRWVHNNDPAVLNFVSGMRLQDTSPKSSVWVDLIRDDGPEIENIMAAGETIRAFEEKMDAKALKDYGYTIDFEGHKCHVLHTLFGNSRVFDSLPEPPEIGMIVKFNGRVYTVSLYSKTVRVNDIAYKYGGGGHPGAAGFTCKKLPWIKE